MPKEYDAVPLTALETLPLALQNFIAHCGADGILGKIDVNSLATFLAPYVTAIGGASYEPASGTVLPNPTEKESAFTFVGTGTYTQTTGGDVVTTEPINVLAWDGETWDLVTAIEIDLNLYATKAESMLRADFLIASTNIPSGSLVESFVTGLWTPTQSNPSGSSVESSRSSNIIPIAPGKTLVWFNISNTVAVSTNSVGYRYTAAGVGTKILVTDLIPLPGDSTGFYYIVPSGDNANYGMNVKNADVATTRMVIATNGSDPADVGKLKDDRIPSTVVRTSGIFEETAGLPNLNEVLTPNGIWATSSSGGYPVTANANYKRSNHFATTIGAKYAISNLNASLANASIGKVFNSAGVPIGIVTPAMLVAKDGYHVVTIPNVTGTVRVGFHFSATEADNVVINEGDTLVLPAIKVKSELLPEPQNQSIVDQVDSDTEALSMFQRGVSTKVYSVAYYGIITSGQSNADGRAPVGTLPPGLATTLPGVRMFNRTTGSFQDAQLGVNSGAEPNTRSDWAFDWGVYQRLRGYLGTFIYVTKRTEGGLPLAADINGTSVNASFNPKFEAIDKAGAVAKTSQLEETFYNATQKAITDGMLVNWKCALWMQGETDRADFKATFPGAYYQNLKNWIAYVRGFAKNAKLKIIVLGIHKDNNYYDATVRAAQQRVAKQKFTWNSATSTLDYSYDTSAEDDFVYFYNMDQHPFTSIGDGIHMNSVLNELVATDIFEIIKDF